MNLQSNSPFYFSSSASPQLTMKFTVATALALPLLAVATPVALDARSDAGSCNTGPIQCCQQTISVSLCIYSYTSRRATNRCKFPRRAPPRRRTSSQACSGSSSAPLRLFLALAAPQSVSSASAVAALATLTPSAARTTASVSYRSLYNVPFIILGTNPASVDGIVALGCTPVNLNL